MPIPPRRGHQPGPPPAQPRRPSRPVRIRHRNPLRKSSKSPLRQAAIPRRKASSSFEAKAARQWRQRRYRPSINPPYPFTTCRQEQFCGCIQSIPGFRSCRKMFFFQFTPCARVFLLLPQLVHHSRVDTSVSCWPLARKPARLISINSAASWPPSLLAGRDQPTGPPLQDPVTVFSAGSAECAPEPLPEHLKQRSACPPLLGASLQTFRRCGYSSWWRGGGDARVRKLPLIRPVFLFRCDGNRRISFSVNP